MTFALWTPPKPVVPIDAGSTDEERLIERRCWDLAAIQRALLAGSLSVNCLEKRHYKNSQWCLPPADGNQFGPLPADAYLMGFNRMKVQENPRLEPHVYIKFAVREAVGQVLVFSLHPSTR